MIEEHSVVKEIRTNGMKIKKKLVMIYIPLTLWDDFFNLCSKMNKSPFATIRGLMRGFIIEEELKGN